MNFERFWSLYPRKVAKRTAQKAWDKELRAGTDPAEIIAGLERQLPTLVRREPQFIPHASTWLHQGRWEDEIEAPRPSNTISAAQSIIARLERDHEREGQDPRGQGHIDHAQFISSTARH
ncbi:MULTISPECIES: hypothetical protein [Chelativorans]|jgi:hypothetical protein|uniref:hypothetical protein n=1 Tax=Chelativorans TaxID=449972 RepID=UPI0012EE01F7|nr:MULTISPECIES: hypothetical protein [Chelativorans]